MESVGNESDGSVVEIEVPRKASPPLIELTEDDIQLNVKMVAPQFSKTRPLTRVSDSPDIMILSESTSQTMEAISPDHWTSDMKKFYNDDWGNEANFTVEGLQAKMDPRPSLWQISKKDFCNPYSRRRRTFYCNNCSQPGHYTYECPEPPHVVKCHMCGVSGHTSNHCPKAMCLNCGNQTGKFDSSCYKCRHQKGLNCLRCGLKGHQRVECPDHFRLFHLTTKSTKIVIPSRCAYKKPEDMWCCNCGHKGHLQFNCNLQKDLAMFKDTLPFVVSYHLDIQDMNQNQDGSNRRKRHSLKRMKKHSKRKSRLLSHESDNPIGKVKHKTKKKKKWKNYKNDIKALLRTNSV